jgi:hypothetical protein
VIQEFYDQEKVSDNKYLTIRKGTSMRSVLWCFKVATLSVVSLHVLGDTSSVGGSTDESQSRREQTEAVTVFEERTLIGAKGQFTVEPSFSYSNNGATTVAIEGYTVIPAVVIGLINVSQLQRDTFTSALSLRYAVNNRLQFGVRVPFVQTSESIREREAFDGTQLDILNYSRGSGLGDVEGSINYQFNGGHAPFYTTSLRVKSRTGKSPFEIERRELVAPNGKPIGLVFVEQPTGSGFVAVQPSLGLIYPSDPAVLYSNVSYLWNRKRNLGEGMGGEIDPGDVVGFSFGIGFAINERTSFSLGYDHNTVLKTRVEARSTNLDASFKRLQIGTFLVGLNQNLTARTNLNVALGMGVTEQAPDLQLTLRVPFMF